MGSDLYMDHNRRHGDEGAAWKRRAERAETEARELHAEVAELRTETERLRAYADKLAAGLPEGMLPKDVELLRDSNAVMADTIAGLENRVLVLTSALAGLEKENDRLRGIVERLPKTADGVPIILGETQIFYCDSFLDRVNDCGVAFVVTVGVSLGAPHVSGRDFQGYHECSRVYSTKEAAEAGGDE